MVPSERPDALKFTFERMRVDGRLVRTFDALLRLVAHFSIEVNGDIAYSEDEFCVVEFAARLARWLARDMGLGAHFVYTSEESEVRGLVEFERAGPEFWRLSVYDLTRGERRTLQPFVDSDAVLLAAEQFAGNLFEALPERPVVLRFLAEEGERELLSLFQKVSRGREEAK